MHYALVTLISPRVSNYVGEVLGRPVVSCQSLAQARCLLGVNGRGSGHIIFLTP